MKMEKGSETSAYKLQTPGNYPEERIQHSGHSESSRWIVIIIAIIIIIIIIIIAIVNIITDANICTKYVSATISREVIEKAPEPWHRIIWY